MIYLLKQEGSDYDCDDLTLYGSTSKAKVEKRMAQLLARHQRLHAIALQVEQQRQEFARSLPEIKEPDYKTLPLRDLIWSDSCGSWQNPYEMEYLKELDERLRVVADYADDLTTKLCQQDDVSLNDDSIWEHLIDIEYYISEVESD